MSSVTSLQPITARGVASRAEVAFNDTLRQLWSLRGAGVAKLINLWVPPQAGRPVQTLTYVTLRLSIPKAIDTFESYCQSDRAVTAVVALAGNADYAIWTAHDDGRSAREWSHQLMRRPEVGRVTPKAVRIRFGHLLQGAPVYRGSGGR